MQCVSEKRLLRAEREVEVAASWDGEFALHFPRGLIFTALPPGHLVTAFSHCHPGQSFSLVLGGERLGFCYQCPELLGRPRRCPSGRAVVGWPCHPSVGCSKLWVSGAASHSWSDTSTHAGKGMEAYGDPLLWLALRQHRGWGAVATPSDSGDPFPNPAPLLLSGPGVASAHQRRGPSLRCG